jgi:hypothetical protein
MEYQKPSIVCFDKAVAAIQGQPKAINTAADNHGDPFLKTVTAYEADE